MSTETVWLIRDREEGGRGYGGGAGEGDYIPIATLARYTCLYCGDGEVLLNVLRCQLTY